VWSQRNLVLTHTREALRHLARLLRLRGRLPFLAQKHGYREGATPSDALLEDFARHFSITVYPLTCTCRIGSVVDPRLQVVGVSKLRVADASVMPNVVSGNTNAASIMIGEQATEMVAADHGVKLAEFVVSISPSASDVSSPMRDSVPNLAV